MQSLHSEEAALPNAAAADGAGDTNGCGAGKYFQGFGLGLKDVSLRRLIHLNKVTSVAAFKYVCLMNASATNLRYTLHVERRVRLLR